jgi:hypothetical protein
MLQPSDSSDTELARAPADKIKAWLGVAHSDPMLELFIAQFLERNPNLHNILALPPPSNGRERCWEMWQGPLELEPSATTPLSQIARNAVLSSLQLWKTALAADEMWLTFGNVSPGVNATVFIEAAHSALLLCLDLANSGLE